MSTRARLWTFIIYPESAPENWRSILDDLALEWIESPLHDKDINPDGSAKKPHCHLMLIFEGMKSYDQILEVTKSVNGTIPLVVHNGRSMARYFCHLDNPDKYQYSRSDIISHGGADVDSFLKPTVSERYILIREMMRYIDENQIKEYSDFLYIAMETRFDDWFPILCDSASYVVGQYIKSIRCKFVHDANLQM